jgi:hypothetical protein
MKFARNSLAMLLIATLSPHAYAQVTPGFPTPMVDGSGVTTAAVSSPAEPFALDLIEIGLPSNAAEHQIGILQQLIVSTADSEADEKAEFIRRLAIVYFGVAQKYAEQSATLQVAVAANRNPASAGKMKAEWKIVLGKRKATFIAAVKTFTLLTKTPAYANAANMDHSLFLFACLLNSSSFFREAVEPSSRLQREFPHSKYVAMLSIMDVIIADARWQGGDFAYAERFYHRVSQDEKSPSGAYTTYRLGAIDFINGNMSEANTKWTSLLTPTKGRPIASPQVQNMAIRALANIVTIEK